MSGVRSKSGAAGHQSIWSTWNFWRTSSSTDCLYKLAGTQEQLPLSSLPPLNPFASPSFCVVVPCLATQYRRQTFWSEQGHLSCVKRILFQRIFGSRFGLGRDKSCVLGTFGAAPPSSSSSGSPPDFLRPLGGALPSLGSPPASLRPSGAAPPSSRPLGAALPSLRTLGLPRATSRHWGAAPPSSKTLGSPPTALRPLGCAAFFLSLGIASGFFESLGNSVCFFEFLKVPCQRL